MYIFFNDNLILILLMAGLAVLTIWNLLLNFRILQIKKRLKAFFNGKKAIDLEGVLFEEIKRLKKAENNVDELFKSTDILKKITNHTIQKTSIVRFNPFKDTGGDQSFAIALLDSNDNGMIISSLFTRQGTRVYSKPIKNGKSKYPLSKEELEALKQAGAKIK